MPHDYFPEVERLLRARASGELPVPNEESGFPTWAHPDVSWPDPREVAARRAVASFHP
jgi:hypothetical protein